MKSVVSALCGIALVACADQPELGEASKASETSNGASLNGASLNGASLNGASLNGASLNGASLNGASLNGASLNGASLNGLSLSGSSLVASNVSDLEGAILVGTLSDGRSINLRIDDITAGTGDNDDVDFHTISVQVDQGWKPLCEDTEGNNLPAIAIAGRWNASTGAKDRTSGYITFACRGGAIAKCVEYLGYKPWASSSLDSHHQACTRTIRADYCGDGRSWTVNGRSINVYDDVGVQSDTESWGPEAEWSESGARCIVRQRVLDLQDVLGLNGVPYCILYKVRLGCAAYPDWNNGTLIVDEAYDLLVNL